MKPYERYLLAFFIIVVDLVVFALPLAAFFAAYILIARPPFFQKCVSKINA